MKPAWSVFCVLPHRHRHHHHDHHHPSETKHAEDAYFLGSGDKVIFPSGTARRTTSNPAATAQYLQNRHGSVRWCKKRLVIIVVFLRLQLSLFHEWNKSGLLNVPLLALIWREERPTIQFNLGFSSHAAVFSLSLSLSLSLYLCVVYASASHIKIRFFWEAGAFDAKGEFVNDRFKCINKVRPHV